MSETLGDRRLAAPKEPGCRYDLSKEGYTEGEEADWTDGRPPFQGEEGEDKNPCGGDEGVCGRACPGGGEKGVHVN